MADDTYGRLWLALGELGRAINGYIRAKRLRVAAEVHEGREVYITGHEDLAVGDDRWQDEASDNGPWPGEQPTTQPPCRRAT